MTEAILELRKLTKCFGGLTAVSNVDMTVRRGDIVGLIGPNGSGKTTLINMMTGYIRPTSGQILFKGRDITAFPPHRIARLGLARTFQLNVLFNGMTVLENTIMGQYTRAKTRDWEDIIPTGLTRKKKAAMREGAMQILESLGLADLTEMDVAQAPHGVKRLLGIALALGNAPEMLLFDEPLSGMNAEETDKTIDFLHALHNNGMTILIIEHNMRAVMQICGRLVVLNYGAKIAEGAPQEIGENADVIRAYLGSRWATA